MGFLSSLFKKKKNEPVQVPPAVSMVDPVPEKTPVPESKVSGTRTKITVRREPAAKEEPKTVKKEAPKKEPSKPAASKGTSPKKETSKKETSKKETSKKAPKTEKDEPKKTAPKKTSAKGPKEIKVPGTVPPELKGLDKELKGYAARSRMTYNSSTANKVFAEYIARILRDKGYRMVFLRDGESGTLTMLDKSGTDDSIRDKILVKCFYQKVGSVGTVSITQALKEAEEIRADRIWCITTTDFNDGAVRKSRKEGVVLYDGRRLYSELLPEMDNTLWD